LTDERSGMEGSENRTHTLIRKAVPSLLLVGIVAVAGCGGGGGSSTSAKPPAPVTSSPKASGGVVTAEGTEGLVGPAGRATSKSQQFEDKSSKIPPGSNHKPKHQNGAAGGVTCDNADATPDDSNQDVLDAAILCLVNGERQDQNLPPLTQNSELAQAASGMCQRMVTEQFFSHETPDGKNVVDRVEPTGYIPDSGDWVVGENLAWGSGALSTPQAILNGWMNSPGHKANILAPDYKDIGLAACQGSPSPDLSGGTVYVNDFGAKSGADLTAKLPPENGTSGNGTAAAATVAGTKTAHKAKAKSKARHKARKHRRHHRRHHHRRHHRRNPA
jgi:uncharacterized protein YkwD